MTHTSDPSLLITMERMFSEWPLSFVTFTSLRGSQTLNDYHN